jgi:hypothetical protein
MPALSKRRLLDLIRFLQYDVLLMQLKRREKERVTEVVKNQLSIFEKEFGNIFMRESNKRNNQVEN